MDEMLIGLVDNAALLLALGVLYDAISRGPRRYTRATAAVTGIGIGLIGMGVMPSPWRFSPGVVFDTRSILLSLAGLFFGVVPTAFAAVMTSLLRLYQDGAGAWTGVGVIIASGALGIVWGSSAGVPGAC